MTQQQLEERKADRELMSHLRRTRLEIQKERKRMGDAAYDEYMHRICLEAAEEYCRNHPEYQLVMLDHGGYKFKKIDTA